MTIPAGSQKAAWQSIYKELVKTTIEDVKRVYNSHIAFYNDLLLDKKIEGVKDEEVCWLFELLEAIEHLVVEKSGVRVKKDVQDGRGNVEHACAWCGAVLPNLILGQHVREWHDKKYVPMNKRTPAEQAEFKKEHYKYEITPETHPLAIKEKQSAEAMVNKVLKQRDDIAKANEIARKFNEKQKANLHEKHERD